MSVFLFVCLFVCLVFLSFYESRCNLRNLKDGVHAYVYFISSLGNGSLTVGIEEIAASDAVASFMHLCVN